MSQQNAVFALISVTWQDTVSGAKEADSVKNEASVKLTNVYLFYQLH